MPRHQLIACGMYAFTPGLRAAWRKLFERFTLGRDAPPELRFDELGPVAGDPRLLLAHGCGYPLLTRWRDRFEPVCVGEFAVDGAAGGDYCSRLVVAADAGIESLADCRGGRVAINAPDSNSGMNLLRDALARAGARPGFFAAVQVTGAHLASVEAVAAGRATLAAIDCISWRYIAEQWPALAARVECIGNTRSTRGLPWLAPRAVTAEIGAERIVAALDRALAAAPATVAERLHLRGFRAVAIEEYRAIGELERAAIAAGYPEIS